jgi:hypothetical protein
VSNLISKISGFLVTCLVLEQEHKTKFAVRAKEMIYLDPAKERDGHRLYNIATGKTVSSRDVHFLEKSVKVSNKHNSAPSSYVDTDTKFILDFN